MQKKHGDQGFALIAQHRQGADLKDKVLTLARQHNVNYTITQGGNIPGDASKGIPHAYLFDWTGACVASGHPSELYKKVDELMQRAPPFVTGGKEFESKAVMKIVSKLKGNSGYGKALADLAKLVDAAGDDVEEASYLKDRLEKYGQGMLESAQEAEGENALAAVTGYKKVESVFKGSEYADKAKARQKELKSDKAFQTELKACKYLAQVEALSGQFRAFGGKINLDHPANRKPAAGIRGLLKKMNKKYSETKAFAKAKEIASGLGL